MQIDQTQNGVRKRSMGLTLGDIGLVTGAAVGVGGSLLGYGDADTGNYVSNVVTNFVNHGYLAAAGFTVMGYSLGRFIDFIKN